VSGLYRFLGDGPATCENCVKDVLDYNIGRANPADWLDDEFGDTTCDVCETVISGPEISKEAAK
jgi:hypothetical protein